MTTQTLYRAAGGGLIAGALLSLIGAALAPAGADAERVRDPLFSAAAAFLLVGGAVCVVAIPGAYARQADRAGASGLVGVCALMLTLLIFGVVVPAGDLLTLPRTVELSPASSAAGAPGQDAPAAFLALLAFGALAALVGAGAFAAGTRRARVFPQGAAWLLVAGALANLLPLFVPGPPGRLLNAIPPLLFYGGLLWLGAALWRDAGERRPSP